MAPLGHIWAQAGFWLTQPVQMLLKKGRPSASASMPGQIWHMPQRTHSSGSTAIFTP